MTPDISVIIVNYNAGPLLKRCLTSIDEHMGSHTWDAVVIDNASSDGSERIADGVSPGTAAEQRWPHVTLIRNLDNVGFARAVNQGFNQTSGRYVLMLNPDGRISPGAVDVLCHEMDLHPDCAIVAPGVVDDEGRREGNARGDPNMLTGLFGRSQWLTRRFPHWAIARRNVLAQPDQPLTNALTSIEVDWVHGACMLVRRDAFAAVGGFDERYFMYWEDADFCRRLRSAGWRVRYRPDAEISHTGRQSSRSAKALAIRAFHNSAYLYYRTHVAPSPLNPLRWLALVLLRARSAWLARG